MKQIVHLPMILYDQKGIWTSYTTADSQFTLDKNCFGSATATTTKSPIFLSNMADLR